MSEWPELHELAKRIFSDLAASYDQALDALTLAQDRHWKTYLLLASLHSGPATVSLLDVGSGTGVLEERLSQGLALRTVGIDLTRAMVKVAKSKGLASEFIVADANCLPFRPGTFDVVMSCYAPKYCDSSHLASESMAVLRAGGRFAVYDFARPHGLFAPVYAFYVYGFLPIFGRLVRPLDRGLAFTCAQLPRIIRSSDWCNELCRALELKGFVDVRRSDMTGGVVSMLSALKPSSPTPPSSSSC